MTFTNVYQIFQEGGNQSFQLESKQNFPHVLEQLNLFTWICYVVRHIFRSEIQSFQWESTKSSCWFCNIWTRPYRFAALFSKFSFKKSSHSNRNLHLHASFGTVKLSYMDSQCCSVNCRGWNGVIRMGVCISMQVLQWLNLVIWIQCIVRQIFASEIQSFKWESTQNPTQVSLGVKVIHIDLPHLPTESLICVNRYTTDNRQWTWDCTFFLNSANITSCCKTTELNLLTSGLNSRICRVTSFWNKLIARNTQKIEPGKYMFCRITMLLAMRKLLEGLALIPLCVFGIKSSFHMTASREWLTDV